MTAVDLMLLGCFAGVLLLLIVGSRVIRTMIWEIVFHPFTKSTIQMAGGTIHVQRDGAHHNGLGAAGAVKKDSGNNHPLPVGA